MDDKAIIDKWKLKRVFNAEQDRFKDKVFILPYLFNMNTYGVSFDKLYPIISVDIINRYNKMCGKNVMFCLSFNDLSFESYTFYHDHHLLPYDLFNEYKNELEYIGIGFDQNKVSYQGMNNFIQFYQEIFLNLFNDKIKLKHGPIFEDTLGLHQYNFYEIAEKDNHYYVRNTKEEVFLQEDDYLALDIEPYFEEIKTIIKKENLPLAVKDNLYQMLKEYSYIEVNLSNFYEDLNITISLDEPELISGISFLALNPTLMDVMTYVNEEEVSAVNKYLENGYQEGIFTGNTVKNPVTGDDIYIFVSYDFDEAIHVAIPSMNEKDKTYALAFGLDVVQIVENDHMINSDFLNGLSRLEARIKIMNSFVQEEMGVVKSSFKVKELVLSMKEQIGLPVPLIEKSDELSYEALDVKFLPVYFNPRGKKVITNEAEMTNSGDLINLCFSDDFISGLYEISSNKLGNELYVSNLDFKGTEIHVVNINNVFKEFLIPQIFKLVLNENTNATYIFYNSSEITQEQLTDVNNLKRNYINDLLKITSRDSLRLFVLANRNEFDFDKIKISVTKYEQFVQSIKSLYKNSFVEEAYNLDQELYSLTQNINFMLSNNDYEPYVTTIMKFFYEHLLNEKMTENQALIYLKLLSLAMPFTSQEIFEEVFLQKYFLVYEEWPFLN